MRECVMCHGRRQSSSLYLAAKYSITEKRYTHIRDIAEVQGGGDTQQYYYCTHANACMTVHCDGTGMFFFCKAFVRYSMLGLSHRWLH